MRVLSVKDPSQTLGLILLLLTASCSTILGLDHRDSLTNLHHTSWTAHEGAPGQITALAQTSDGYLWIGTTHGVFRFDGVRFQVYEPPSEETFPSNDVYSMLAVAGDGLWIGYRFGGVSFVKGRRVVNYGERESFRPGRVTRFAQDQDGSVWAATAGGLAHFDGSRWEFIGKDWNFPGPSANTVFVDTRGTVWASTADTIVFLPRGTRQFRSTGMKVGQVPMITEAPDGGIWFTEITSGFVRPVEVPSDREHRKSNGLHVGGSMTFLFDRNQEMWVTTVGEGVRHLTRPAWLNYESTGLPSREMETFTEKQGLSADYVWPMIEDREGNIWVGTSKGLDQFRNNLLSSVPFPSVFLQYALVAGDNGDLWVGNLSQRLVRIHGRTGEVERTNYYASCGFRDAAGVTWFANQKGVWRFEARWQVSLPYPKVIKTPQLYPDAMTEDRFGTLWIAIPEGGIFYQQNGAWLRYETPTDFPRLNPLSAFTDWAGRMWFGYGLGKIAELEPNSLKTFSSADGLQVGSIRAIAGRKPHLWIGGELGLVRFDEEHFFAVLPSDDNQFSSISGIVETADGSLWLSESRGVIHIPAAEITKHVGDPNHRVAYELLDFRDGLPGTILQGPFPTAIQATDGRLWFATTGGPTSIDPSNILRNNIPPPVSIQTIAANGTTFSDPENVQLPVHTTSLQIGYEGLSLSVPERVRFRYLLEGVDKDWQDAGTRREAFYTGLLPRRYRFRVTACNNDGVWNEQGATLQFSILPAFYQTRWFAFLCLAVATTLAWTAYRYRVDEVTSRLNMQFRERLSERTRIAGELHDTLLQSVQGLILHFQRVRNLLPANPAEAAQRIDVALERAEQAIVEGRNAIHDIRSSTIVEHDLATAITRLGDELRMADSEQSSTILNVVIEGAVRPLAPSVHDEIYRIIREALRNAFSHANAHIIEVEIAFGEKIFWARIRDDGKGFDPATLEQKKPTGHWGLVGMRERAKRMGGQLNMWSKQKAGTEIELTVPGVIAYGVSSAVKGFRLFRKLNRKA